MKAKCPFCGAEDLIIDVAIIVTANVVDGKLQLRSDLSAVKEQLENISEGEMKGYCKHCHNEFIKIGFDEEGNITPIKEVVSYTSDSTWE